MTRNRKNLEDDEDDEYDEIDEKNFKIPNSLIDAKPISYDPFEDFPESETN